MSNKPILWVDAGHGGTDSGAVGPNGLKEKDVVLSVAMLLGAELAGDFNVQYSRKTDVFVSLSERARLANAAGADAFISIHCNSAENPAQGFEVFTTPGETASDNLATDVFLSWASAFPTATKRMDVSDGDPDKEAAVLGNQAAAGGHPRKDRLLAIPQRGRERLQPRAVDG